MRLTLKTSATLFLSILAITGCLTVAHAEVTKPDVMVYKSPNCGCCGKWVSYLQMHGFTVNVENTRQLKALKSKLGVKRELSSCHTAIIGPYTVEGHVPVEAINLLLTQKPDVRGIAVPGMPAGSPGMESANPVSYNVYSFDKTGKRKVFMKID